MWKKCDRGNICRGVCCRAWGRRDRYLLVVDRYNDVCEKLVGDCDMYRVIVVTVGGGDWCIEFVGG